MSSTHRRSTRSASPVSDPVLAVVDLARRAPSMHNTQPWAWRAADGALELWADPARQLRHADPRGRNLVISCGAALHHAEVAARGLGWEPTIRRWPDGPGSDLVAAIELEPRAPGTADVERLRRLVGRRTDRRRFTSWPVGRDRLEPLISEGRSRGVDVVTLDVVDRIRVEDLVVRAHGVQAADPATLEESARWVDRSSVDGVPSAVVPAPGRRPASRLPRFEGGTLDDEQPMVATTDGVLVLCSPTDDRPAWGRVGEALSAMWLATGVIGLSVVPLSQVIEVEETRAALARDVLRGEAVPQMLFRVGWQLIGRNGLPPTPRRSLEEILRP